jgi:hypothetical protein
MTNNNTTAPWHFGIHHANSTQEWLPTDTKENFDRLMQDPNHQKYFGDLGWDQPGAITYTINSDGFRCEEFVNTPCMISLGCSFTLGIGLPLDVIWPILLGKATGLKVANLAWNGNSSDTCFRLAEYWIPKLRPKLVSMLAPPDTRLEIILDANEYRLPVDVIMPEVRSALFSDSDMFLKHWHLNDENSRLNQLKNCLAVRQLCAEHNIPCVIERSQDHMTCSREEIGYARDFMHGGPIIHKRIAEKMLNVYQTWT